MMKILVAELQVGGSIVKEKIELRHGEKIMDETKGDLWTGVAIARKQKRGFYTFTNKRIIFVPTTLISIGSNMEIKYTEIANIKKCAVGLLMPFGLKITTREGNKHTLSLLNRNKWLELINQHI